MKSKVNLLIIVLVIVIVIIGAILIFSGPKVEVEPETETEEEITIDTTGTVTYIDLEGGFFGIVSFDGYQYFPINLDESLQEDGLEIDFTARVDEDYVDVHMWGLPVEIIEAGIAEETEEAVEGEVEEEVETPAE